MEKINEEFNVPIYIVQEIVDYIELTALRSLQVYEMGEYKSTFKVSSSQ